MHIQSFLSNIFFGFCVFIIVTNHINFNVDYYTFIVLEVNL